jgi:hypothetical protein
VFVSHHPVAFVAFVSHPFAELVVRHDRVQDIDYPLELSDFLTYLSRKVGQISVFREEVSHILELGAEPEHALDGKRLVVRHVQMLDFIQLQGFALATQQVLHEEYRDRPVVRQVELAVHCEQATSDKHVADHLLEDLLLALILRSEHGACDGGALPCKVRVSLHRFNLLIITAASASRFRLIRPIN